MTYAAQIYPALFGLGINHRAAVEWRPAQGYLEGWGTPRTNSAGFEHHFTIICISFESTIYNSCVMSIYFHILIIYASHLRSDLLALVSNDEADNLSSLMLLIDLEPFVSPFDRLRDLMVSKWSRLHRLRQLKVFSCCFSLTIWGWNGSFWLILVKPLLRKSF